MKEGSQFRVRKTYEEVADYLKEQIMSGVYQAGDRLPSLRELGEMLGVGQSTLREAISSLKTMGLLTIRQGEGTFVTKLNPEQVMNSFEHIQPLTNQDTQDLLEVRKIVEVGIVRLAAERRNEEDLRQIQAALDEMQACLHQGDLGEQADWQFHYAIAVASRNSILESMMQSLSETLQKSLKNNREQMYRHPGTPERLLAEHTRIYHAITEQDPNAAEEAMLTHLRGVERDMLHDKSVTP
ncbi:FadR/GntR family transcriptional regulator [Brevibacillus dissolubilis]|uniref:FadR/GntR family transcriptional regulator n=1 Tax=Brevibacillus dissolubilis TaxID=1844116 RepID=UPI001115F2CE|nr:FadR/GntR family transcriptional regulator [Brevibacillus dissolubilis]